MGKDMINTRTASIWLDDEGIVRVVIRPGSAVTLEDAQETKEAVNTLVDDRKRVILIVARGIQSMSSEARTYLGDLQTWGDDYGQGHSR